MKSATNGEIRNDQLRSSIAVYQQRACSDSLHHLPGATKNFLGVNIGGSGKIIASLANLIAYRIYVKEKGRTLKYIAVFTASSSITLILSIVFGYLRLKLTGL